MAEWRYLFSPLQIGRITVRNRIVSTAHITGFAEDHLPNDRHAAYYGERAKGGIGLIVMEGVIPHPTGVALPRLVYAWNDDVIPGFRKIADAVHQWGAKIFCQIWHPGREMTGLFTRTPVLAPSPVPCPANREIPKAMDMGEIAEIRSSFASAALRVQAGGFDGVEIHGGHGYLIEQFLSPLTNKRTDAYGGSLDNRLRFPFEVIRAVRQAVGKEFVVGIRLSADEFFPGGLGVEGMAEVAARLEATGLLDFIDVTVGISATFPVIVGDMSFPPAYEVDLAAAIKARAGGLPVFSTGRINDPLLAEKILEEGRADMIGMTRATICDPELPAKAREGRLEDIRRCIACNQGCVGRLLKGVEISCLQNPAVGRERELGEGTLVPAARKKRVLVVGGGPAGMEAARVAALRGHDVVVCERQEHLGGQLDLLARVPGKEEFGEVVRYLESQIRKLGVDVRLGQDVDERLIRKIAPDAVVIATGSEPALPPLEGAHTATVLTAEGALANGRDIGQRVLVFEDDFHLQGVAVIESLMRRGVHVEVVTPLLIAGMDLPPMNLMTFYHRAFAAGVTFTGSHSIRRVNGRSVVIFNVFSQAERELRDIDAIVAVTGNQARSGLLHAIQGQAPETYGVGDCVSPRKALEAIHEGHLVGRRI